MEKIRIPIFITTGFLAFYIMTPFIGVPTALIPTFFLMINAMFIWMVLQVLKKGVPGVKTFKESWYEDYSGRSIEETQIAPVHTFE